MNLTFDINRLRKQAFNSEPITFGEYYKILAEPYEALMVEDCNFSMRLYNVLRGKVRILTIFELLKVKLFDFAQIKGIGTTTIEEIDAFFKNLDKIQFIEKNDDIYDGQKKALSIAKEHGEDIVCGNFKFVEEIDSFEELDDLILRYKEAHNIIDSEIILNTYLNPQPSIEIMHAFQKFSHKYIENEKRKDIFYQEVSALPDKKKNNKALGYINAYTINQELRDILYSLYENSESLSSMNCVNRLNNENDFQLLLKFIKWANFDIHKDVCALFETHYSKENTRIVVQMRSRGNTLEQIGNVLGVTRERVRQLESKAKLKFNSWQARNRILLKISAERNSDDVLTTTEIASFCGKYATELLFLLRVCSSKTYKYDEHLDMFVVGEADISARVIEYVEELPDEFSNNDIAKIFDEACDEYNLPLELIEKAISEEFNITGTIYHRSKLSLTNIYKNILNEFYSSGIKAYDDLELQEFRHKINETYGDVKLPVNNRAISARIADVGILMGRGIYGPRKESYIPKDLSDKIYKYITESESTIFLTNTLYSVFEDELNIFGIDNKYYLQGIMHQMYGDKFVFRRDYISKDESVSSIYFEIIEFIRKHDYPISKKEIYDAFPGVTEIIINIAISDNSILNYFGEYLHVDNLKIYSYDIQYLEKTLDKILIGKEIYHGKDIYDVISKDNDELLNRLGY